jgi:hypothetical protein
MRVVRTEYFRLQPFVIRPAVNRLLLLRVGTISSRPPARPAALAAAGPFSD